MTDAQRTWLLTALNRAWLHGAGYAKPGSPKSGDMLKILADIEGEIGPAPIAHERYPHAVEVLRREAQSNRRFAAQRLEAVRAIVTLTGERHKCVEHEKSAARLFAEAAELEAAAGLLDTEHA